MEVSKKKCINCNKEFVPSKNDVRIKFCCEDCRKEYRKKNDYMKEYYKNNKEKYYEMNHSDRHKERKNTARNIRYHEDEVFRRKVIEKSKNYRIRHPDAKRNQDYMEKYGMTIDDYNKILESQGGKCAICGKPNSGINGRDRLFVDHDHKTGMVRGLLCSNCNHGLGNFHDNISFLESAIDYLEVYQA